MHTPRPWYRKFNDTWYVQVGKKQVPLAKGKANRAVMRRRYREVIAELAVAQPAESPLACVASLCEAFLEWSCRHNTETTYRWYRTYLQSFCDAYGAVRLTELKPYHVTRWLDSHNWGNSSRRCAISAVKRAMNWATDEGFIPQSPIRSIKKPAPVCRTEVITPETHQQICQATDPPFRLLVTALNQTGARPHEVASVTADHVDLSAGTWTLREHKTARRTGKPRVIYLTPCMSTLSRILMATRPSGPLFRNRYGKPWSRNAIRCRMRRLRKKLDLERGIVAYTYRHSFATEGLAAGVPIATMAELLGHVDIKMVSQHYGHLSRKTDHLRRAALLAVQNRSVEDA